MTSRWPSSLLIGVLCLSAVLPYLINLGYWASDPEVLLLSAGAAIIGLAIGLAAAPWPRLTAALAAFAVYWIGDAYFANTNLMVPAAAVAGLLVYIGLSRAIATALRPMLIAFGFAWTVSNVLSPAPALLESSPPPSLPAATSAALRPPIIHFIFDELMSPTAVPGSLPQAPHPAAELIPGLTRRGFDVYTNARSISVFTRISVSSLMGLSNTTENWHWEGGKFTTRVKDNAYARELTGKGYRRTVYQNTYIGLCTGGEDERCKTFSRGGNGHAYSGLSGNLLDRAIFALIEMDNQLNRPSAVGTVAAYALAKRLLGKAGLAVEPHDYYSTPAANLAVMNDIASALQDVKPGEAYLFHVLLPHSPLTLDESCRLRPSSRWSRGNRPDRPVRFTDAEIYRHYWDQAGCMTTRMFAIVDQVLATHAGKDAIIMIHGDHGARVTHEHGEGEDPNDLLQTLFAVRHPQSSGVVRHEPVILQDVFAQHYRRLVP